MGLDMTAFRPATPAFLPVLAADQTAAWKGPHPKIPNLDLTVEYGDVERPGDGGQAGVWLEPRRRSPDGQTRGALARGIFLLILSGLGVLAALLLARRNWRMGRTDRRGALRIAAAEFFLAMIVWLGTVHAVPAAPRWDSSWPALPPGWERPFPSGLLYLALELRCARAGRTRSSRGIEFWPGAGGMRRWARTF